MLSLVKQIDESGLSCQAGSEITELEDAVHNSKVDAVLLDHSSVGIGAQAAIEQIGQLGLPTILMVGSTSLSQFDPGTNADDFIVTPINRAELLVRVSLMVFRRNGRDSEQVVRVGDLTIDLQSYEVTMAGRRISLTYKEFQLLTLLASNPGRVYTREALLNQVWGYDYLGGTRTVDVHIRRLRSKVEDPDHLFVETIWNVGYRFRDVGAEG